MPKASQDDHICRQHKHDIQVQQGLRDSNLRTMNRVMKDICTKHVAWPTLR